LSPSTPTFKISGSDQELVIWILDYDCIRYMAQDSHGVQQAVDAFYRNDPYFPRPFVFGHREEDVEVWEISRTQFLSESKKILGDNGIALADEWVDGVENEEARRKRLVGRNGVGLQDFG
jgi:hypothetical protein